MFSIKDISPTGRSGLTGPICVTFRIVILCNQIPEFVLLIVNHLPTQVLSDCICIVVILVRPPRPSHLLFAFSSLTGVTSVPWISGDLNLIIIPVFSSCCHL